MKKEEIYVVIDSEKKRLRAIKILTDAGESIAKGSVLLSFSENYRFLQIGINYIWYIDRISNIIRNMQEITLDQLEQMLNPKQEEPIKLDALKLIAESYGFELVEKKREIKVGDFGRFSQSKDSHSVFGFLNEIEDFSLVLPYKSDLGTWFKNFRHLTEEEKAKITENW
jgi:hypothetical protein